MRRRDVLILLAGVLAGARILKFGKHELLYSPSLLLNVIQDKVVEDVVIFVRTDFDNARAPVALIYTLFVGL